MILKELHGYRKYIDKDFYEIVSSIKDAYVNCQGTFSVVVIPKNSDSVYKVWTNDPGYEAYYDIAKSMQGNVYVPRLSKIHRVPIFFKRSAEVDGHLNIVKIERLAPIKHQGDSAMIASFIGVNSMESVSFTGYTQEHFDTNVKSFIKHAKVNAELAAKLEATSTDLYELVVKLKQVITSKGPSLKVDLHSDNIMLRGQQVVIIDPFCLEGDYEIDARDEGLLFVDQLSTYKISNVKTGSRPSTKG